MLEIRKEKKFHALGEVSLEGGERLRNARICYQVLGTPNRARDNLVLIPSYYGGTHWGSLPLLGADSPLATGEHCIVLTDLLGAGWSTSPSNAAPGQQGADFPRVSLLDNVRVQKALLDRLFGDDWQLALVTGWSMGGMQTLYWAMAYPERMRAILPFCCTARCWPHNQVFLEGVKAALCADADWQGGRYATPPERGLRAFGRAYAGWAYSQAFFRRELWRGLGFASVEALLDYWERDHLEQDANDLLCVLDTWQCADPAHSFGGGSLAEALGRIQARTIVMPGSTDLYFTVDDARHEASLMPNAELRVLESDWGHCAGGPGRDPQAMAQIFAAMRALLGRQ
ncbi:alpha/beta fold hydrolase [Pseudomonas lopnurensis]|uniref:alpha/beta fold hydrolase n=1 Tax=Pseudomonas lopnurensis TaxID=1477517 RepID=UPI00187AF166|nr:alpha/beta fold hydrolase [Pseudomonas lopnurensis]MBE7375224.1 alpha/beta fold hydrolase [Pseudomonas lopnurensis]